MSRKRIKALALLMAVLFLLPVQMGDKAALAAKETSKIHPVLQEKMDKTDKELPVYIHVKVPTQEFWNGGESYYQQQINYYLEKLNLDKNKFVLDIVYMYPIAKGWIRADQEHSSIPILTVWLTVEEINWIAGQETVTSIVGIQDRTSWYSPIITRVYNATSALSMLQISVGLQPQAVVEVPDANHDGAVTAVDALLALQVSVGLIVIADYLNVHSWKLIGGGNPVEPYDWERERVPADIFLCAGDENGDGIADATDIMLKFGYLWA